MVGDVAATEIEKYPDQLLKKRSSERPTTVLLSLQN